MILQALYEYYEQKAERGEIAPAGFTRKVIDFLIIVDEEGKYVDVENLQTLQGKKLVGREYDVPSIGKQAEKHSNAGNDANLLWDKAEFVLGLGRKGEMKLASFIETIKRYYPDPPEDVAIVLRFLEKERKKKNPFGAVVGHKEAGEMIQTGASTLSFRILKKLEPVFSAKHVAKALKNAKQDKNTLGTCLITGESKVPIELTHTVTKRIMGAQSSGANLVSFNKDAFLSYGKKQSLTAPISKWAAAGYTKALQSIIDSERNKARVGDATIVFWAGKNKETEFFDLENQFVWYIADKKDDPDRGVRAVKALYDAIHTGKLSHSIERFYVLGLSPNTARISVRFFRQGTVRDFGERIKRHFDDFEIVHSPRDPEYISLYRILTSTAFEYKMDNVPPNLAGAVIESILDGTPYPVTLLQQCIRRIRAEVSRKDQSGKLMQNVTRTRAAILKASLNRMYRSQLHNTNKEIPMALDTENTDVAYLLGRLFALLERIQEESARPSKLNSTIRERFYASFSSSPSVVMPLLMRLKNHHLAKLGSERDYLKRWFEEQVGAVINHLKSASIPAHLTLEQQAQFAVGYYHQRMYRKQEQP